MKFNRSELISLIEEKIRETLKEYKYRQTISPDNSKVVRDYNMKSNPLAVDNGGHSSNDVVRQASTYDYNGETFDTNNRIIVSPNKFTIYKIKNFGSDKISSTMSLFGKGSIGEKGLRSAIDLLNGGAVRNNKSIQYRTITPYSSEEKAKKSGWMIDTFWEFTLNGGETWCILKPNPLENMKIAK